MARLLAYDKIHWLKAMETNPALANVFLLDLLINANNVNMKKIGVSLGVLLITKVSNFQISDIVQDDRSVMQITSSILRYLIKAQRTFQDYVEDEIDDVHERINIFEQKTEQTA